MSRIVTACLALVLLVGLSSAARAQSEAGGQSTLIAPDARADGMGRAFTAIANDANAIWWNPGGMAFARGHDVTLMYIPLVPDLSSDVNYSNLSYVQHSDGLGGIGASIAYLSYGKSEATDVDGNPTGEFTSYELVPAIAYGTDLGKNLGLGIALKLIRVDLAPANVTLDGKAGSGTTFAADFGALFKVPSWKSSGATLNNIGPNISYIDVDQSDPLGRNVRIGAAFSPVETDIHRVIISADATRFLLPGRTLAVDVWDVGGEYTFNQLISLRAGYISDPIGTITSYTLGFGVAYHGFSLDYANVPQSEFLERVNRYSVGYRF